MKYKVRGYFSATFYGLAHLMETDDYDKAVDACHEYASDGDFVEMINTETGNCLRWTPDEWMACIEQGDVPENVKSLYWDRKEVVMDDARECPVCGKEVERRDMLFTRDCHGIPFRLVCMSCYEKLMENGYDGQYYTEANENF